MIQDYRQRITSGGADFATLASTESHCSSARRGGDLGPFGPGQMQKAFEDVSLMPLLPHVKCWVELCDLCPLHPGQMQKASQNRM